MPDAMKDSLPLQPGHYEIHIKEQIDEKWLDWFDEFAVTHMASGKTLLKGVVRDQSALHGLLAKIRDLNLTLISINRVEDVLIHSGSQVASLTAGKGKDKYSP